MRAVQHALLKKAFFYVVRKFRCCGVCMLNAWGSDVVCF